jgi:High potential iron-sulfur protein
VATFGTRQFKDNPMTDSNRRSFMLQIAAAGSALAASNSAVAQAGPALTETDAQAAALGYSVDTTKVDVKKYPKHEAAQKCTNCQLFVGKATDAAGGCALFAGKQVAGNGWCSAWAKKVG